MHCPFCGELGEDRDGVFVCTATSADLSPVASAELHAIAENDPDRAPKTALTRWGGTWHCPGDGEPMTETAGHMVCASCGRSLPGRLLYQLIEFNWHPPAA